MNQYSLIIESASELADITRMVYLGDSYTEACMSYMEYAVDLDNESLFEEASEAGKSSFVTLIGNVFKKIKEMLGKAISKLRDVFQTAKIKATMSGESRALLKAAKEGKVVGPDLIKLGKIIKKSQDFISKYSATIEKYVSSAEKNDVRAAEKITRYHFRAIKEYDKLVSQFDAVRKTKKKLTADMVMQALKKGIDVGKSQEKFMKEMEQFEEAFSKSAVSLWTNVHKTLSKRKIRKINKEVLKESAFFTEADDQPVDNMPETHGLIAGIKKAIHGIGQFISRHKTLVVSLAALFVGLRIGEKNGVEKGKKEGYKEGYKIGEDEGRYSGFKDGRKYQKIFDEN